MDTVPVICRHFCHLALDDGRFLLCPFDGSCAVALAAPAGNVAVHLVEASLFLVDVVAELAPIGLVEDLVDQLEAACLAGPVFLWTLLAEV
jgi:hypothetical protein